MLKAESFSVGSCLLTLLLAARPFDPPVKRIPKSLQEWEIFRSFCKNIKRYSAYALCKVFNLRFRKVLLKHIDPNPDTRLTLDQFLLDEWFARHTPRQFEDGFSIRKGMDFFSHNPLTIGKQMKKLLSRILRQKKVQYLLIQRKLCLNKKYLS